jgi:hypothetical protein
MQECRWRRAFSWRRWALGIDMTQVNQPHMQNALNDLNLAKGELQVAMHNKGGHRVNALNLTKQAIGEVEAGIAAGD